MSEYTKGPWEYDNYGTGIMGVGKGGIHETEDEFLIASIRGWGHLQYLGHDKAVAIQEANAHLIAAAPDMYEALKELCSLFRIGDKFICPCRHDCINDECGKCLVTEGYLQAYKAIAKAEGK